MRNPIEIRQVDVGRGKARKIWRRCGRDGRRFSILEPNPNDVLNAAHCRRLRLRLNVAGNIDCLSVQASDRDKNNHTQYEYGSQRSCHPFLLRENRIAMMDDKLNAGQVLRRKSSVLKKLPITEPRVIARLLQRQRESSRMKRRGADQETGSEIQTLNISISHRFRSLDFSSSLLEVIG